MTKRIAPGQTEDNFLFEYFFAQSNPAVCSLPNLVISNRWPSLPLVLDTVGCKGGAWQNIPPFAEEGRPFLDCESAGYDYFRSWGIDVNQVWLRDRGVIFRLGAFTMLLDVNTPDTVLDWFYERSIKEYVPLLDDMQPLIAERMEDLRWAYFPLTDECPIAMFVTRPANRHWVDSLEEAVRMGGGPFCRVFNDGQRCTWRLPDELKRLCRTVGAWGQT